MARFGGDEPPSEPGGSSAPPGVFDLSDSGLIEFPARGAVKDLRYARELDLQGNALTYCRKVDSPGANGSNRWR